MIRKTKEKDGWEIHEVLAEESGNRRNRYFFKRKRAPRVELKGKISAKLAAYTLIEKDLRNVLTWLSEVEKLHPNPREGKIAIASDREKFNIIKGLYVAALTFYGKCFTSCVGRRVKLEKIMLDDEYHQMHEHIMHMRNNFAAHSGAENFEEVKVALVLHPDKKIDAKPIIYRELMQPDFVDDSELTFIKLVNHVRSKVLRKIDQIEEKVYEKEVRPKGKLHWYKVANK